MDFRRGWYLAVRAYVALLVVGVILLVAWLLYPSVVNAPDLAGLWVGLAGFVGLVLAMVYLIELSRDQ